MEGFLISSVFMLTLLCCINDIVEGAPFESTMESNTNYRDKFSLLDENSNGRIDKLEIEKWKVMKKRLQDFDLNYDGNIDFSEYYISNPQPKDETLYQYRDGDGWINVSSVIRVLDLVMQDFDRNMDNKITYKEFLKKLSE